MLRAIRLIDLDIKPGTHVTDDKGRRLSEEQQQAKYEADKTTQQILTIEGSSGNPQARTGFAVDAMW